MLDVEGRHKCSLGEITTPFVMDLNLQREMNPLELKSLSAVLIDFCHAHVDNIERCTSSVVKSESINEIDEQRIFYFSLVRHFETSN